MRQAEFHDSLLLRDALHSFFSKYQFENGGYDKSWFKVKLGPIMFSLPNFPARIEAVKLHDIHHVLNEYKADLKGEAEISAWEISSGCGRYWVAWLLDFMAFQYGIIFYTKAVINAFLKGRLVNANFYNPKYSYPELLQMHLGQLRKEIGSGAIKNNSFKDYMILILWIFLALFFMYLPIAIILHVL